MKRPLRRGARHRAACASPPSSHRSTSACRPRRRRVACRRPGRHRPSSAHRPRIHPLAPHTLPRIAGSDHADQAPRSGLAQASPMGHTAISSRGSLASASTGEQHFTPFRRRIARDRRRCLQLFAAAPTDIPGPVHGPVHEPAHAAGAWRSAVAAWAVLAGVRANKHKRSDAV
jgi:hypothetical protein